MDNPNREIMSFSFTPEFARELRAAIPENQRSFQVEEALRPRVGMPPRMGDWQAGRVEEKHAGGEG